MSCCSGCNVVGSGCSVCPVAKSGQRPTMMLVGAPPLIVSMGAPGARGEVLGYVDRVEAFRQKFDTAMDRWLELRGVKITTKPDGGFTPDFGKATPADQSFILQWGDLERRWFEWNRQMHADLVPFGPSPAEAWEKTMLFEAEWKAAAKQLASMPDGSSVGVPADPGLLEKPGGAPGGLSGAIGEVGDSLATSIGKLPIVPILAIGGAVVVGLAFAGRK